jgi:hypothetical protein
MTNLICAVAIAAFALLASAAVNFGLASAGVPNTKTQAPPVTGEAETKTRP